MAKVVGVGGIFFKAKDAKTLREWYQRVLGLQVEEWGGVVFAPEVAVKVPGAATVWSPFAANSNYFAPSEKDFMINLMVDDLDSILARCKEHGVEPVNPVVDDFNGRFAHVLDPEGLKIELWQPKAAG